MKFAQKTNKPLSKQTAWTSKKLQSILEFFFTILILKYTTSN